MLPECPGACENVVRPAACTELCLMRDDDLLALQCCSLGDAAVTMLRADP